MTDVGEHDKSDGDSGTRKPSTASSSGKIPTNPGDIQNVATVDNQKQSTLKPVIETTSADSSTAQTAASLPTPESSKEADAKRAALRQDSTLEGLETSSPAVRCCKLLLNTKGFRALGLISLGLALFGGPLFIVFNLPDDPWVPVADIIMTVVTAFFILELVLRCAADQGRYPFSFFFFMDVVGTASMIFEISFLLGPAGKMDTVDTKINTVLMRAVRTAKLGARAARMAKIMKCLVAIYGATNDEVRDYGVNARVLNSRLMTVLSTKVSMLTIVLVLGMPLFSIGRYPESDLSMQAWTRRLESDYNNAYELLEESDRDVTNIFSESVEEMVEFYSVLTYFPFEIEGYPEAVLVGPSPGRQATIPGCELLSKKEPGRLQNIVRAKVSCRRHRAGCEGGEASLWFDFTGVRQFDAGMDMLVIIFIIICMCLESFDLSQTLNFMVVKPVEKMMATVHMMKEVLSQVKEIGDLDDEPPPPVKTTSGKIREPKKTEADHIEAVFRKLSRLTNVFLHESMVGKDEMHELNYESQGVLVQVLGQAQPGRRISQVGIQKTPTEELILVDMPADAETIDSWGLNVLTMSRPNLHKVALFLLFNSQVMPPSCQSVRADSRIFRSFLEKVSAQYREANPYHNYTHAVDVLASVCRILTMVRWQEWMSNVDVYALLVSAICHDVGHPGKTNPFLVEIADELAVRYNDKSPLENMHCAKLFETAKHQDSNVFELLDKVSFKQARSVCISSILHTDNALHFDMVKALKKVYEVSQFVCDQQASGLADKKELTNDFVNDVLVKETVLWCELFLHMADISNPLKPFALSRQWASHVVDEFFLQGDEEKRLGIPIGMLNDREKVNKLSSEHGFINFLVAPLVTTAGCVVPMVSPLSKQLLHNLESWRDVWMSESAPAPKEEDVKKRDADVLKLKTTVDEIVGRYEGAC